ncbi:MAG: MMPL family transporter [Ignavibacteria bacterium]|jgi:predicted RND superfamily exporter protein
MKIQQINTFFKKMGSFQIRHRWMFILLALILTAFGITGIDKIRMKNDRDSWFDDTEAIEIATEKFEDQFGNNDNIGILVQADDVFHPEVLKAIKALGDSLLKKVPYTDEITSLTELEVSVGTEEGIEIINPFEDGIPGDPAKIEEIRELILSRKSIADKLVSADSKETWLTVELLEYPESEVWEKKTNIDPMFEVGEAAIEIVTDSMWKSDLYTLKAAGMPYSETEERDFFGKEAPTRVLSGFVVMIILLIFFLRSITGVFVPIFTTAMGIIVVFGGMGWLDIGVESMMMTFPVLLGMALSVGYSIHLVNAFKRFFKQTGKRKESMISAVEETGWPIFFTAITTIGSVMSFASTGIMTISWLGFTCAAVVLAVYLFVMSLIPVMMSFGKDREIAADKKNKESFFDRCMSGLGVFVLKRKGITLFIAFICLLALIPGIFKISVNVDVFRMMGLKIPYIQRLYDVANSQLGSYLTYNITIDYDDENAIKDPEVMKNFDAFVDTLSAFKLTKKNESASTVFSILDIIKDMNQTFHSDSATYYRVPDNRELIAQLLFLYEISGGTKTFRWIDEDFSMLRAQVRISKYETNEIVREMNTIHKIGRENFPGAKISIVGSAIQFAELNKKIVTGELKSLLAALVTISVLLIIVFSSFKTGLIGMLPNISPLIVIGGYMGYLNSSLDMITMTIMPMMLGIAVDDTIHFINHIKCEFELCGNYGQAILNSFKKIGKTLTMTTIILSATFGMYIFSPMTAMARMGLFAAMGLTAALVIDYLMTPALIMYTKPFGKETSG